MENIEQFYKRVPQANPLQLKQNNAGKGHFNVFARHVCSFVSPYNRRDYYKISYIVGKGVLYYADKHIYINKPALLFSNPKVPYAWEAENEDQKGWFCLFNDYFLNNEEKVGLLHNSPIFKLNRRPVFFLDEQQQEQINNIFISMHNEIQGNYEHRYDLIRSYLHVLMHEGMKMQEPDDFKVNNNASGRITQLFLELLERQFPIDSPNTRLELNTAKIFADHLCVHTNHLNRSVKIETNKTTTEIIKERIATEAKALLQHTTWSISEIAYSLGFDSQAYFTNFFKKITGDSPSLYRNSI